MHGCGQRSWRTAWPGLSDARPRGPGVTPSVPAPGALSGLRPGRACPTHDPAGQAEYDTAAPRRRAQRRGGAAAVLPSVPAPDEAARNLMSLYAVSVPRSGQAAISRTGTTWASQAAIQPSWTSPNLPKDRQQHPLSRPVDWVSVTRGPFCAVRGEEPECAALKSHSSIAQCFQLYIVFCRFTPAHRRARCSAAR